MCIAGGLIIVDTDILIYDSVLLNYNSNLLTIMELNFSRGGVWKTSQHHCSRRRPQLFTSQTWSYGSAFDRHVRHRGGSSLAGAVASTINHILPCMGAAGDVFTVWGLANWAILVRLAGSSSWPTLNSPADWAEWAAWMIAWDLSIYHSSHLVPAWWGRGRQGKTHNTRMEMCDGALHTINRWHTYSLQYIKLIMPLRKWANTY